MPGRGSVASPKPIRGMHAFTRRKQARERLEAAYEIVNHRDENRSRVSGCLLLPSSPDPRQRREHHHLHGRRVQPEHRENPDLIVLVSAFEHDLITAGALIHEGDDATKRIVWHWDRSRIPVGQEPLQIKSKRRSQSSDEDDL